MKTILAIIIIGVVCCLALADMAHAEDDYIGPPTPKPSPDHVANTYQLADDADYDKAGEPLVTYQPSTTRSLLSWVRLMLVVL